MEYTTPNTVILMIAGYILFVLALAWGESRLLMKWQFGGKIGSLIYAIPVHLITAVVAPVGMMAALAAGMLGVLSAVNNTEGVTTDVAFRSVAVPIAWASIILLLAVRAVPLFFMNLRRSPSKALLYGVFTCPVFCAIYLVLGVPALGLVTSAN